jgi:hypothetical protein
LTGEEEKANLEEVNDGIRHMPRFREQIEPLFQDVELTTHEHRLRVSFQNLQDEFNIFASKRMMEGRFWLIMSQIPTSSSLVSG